MVRRNGCEDGADRLTRAPFVKVCCISSRDEAAMAIAAGASALGLVSAMPSGPGVIDEGLIAELAAYVPPPVATFLLTSLQHADAIAEQHARCRTSTIQLVDDVALDELRRLRTRLPGIKLVQVIHVNDEASVHEALRVQPFGLDLCSGVRTHGALDAQKLHDFMHATRQTVRVRSPSTG